MEIQVFGKQEIIDEFLAKNPQLTVVNDANVVISLGGDGTFLHAIHHFGLDKYYLPINYGSLGFFTSFNHDDFELDDVDITNVCEFYLPVVCINDQCQFFVNEVRLTNPINTSSYTLTINNTELKYRASGMEIVAPFGTTGCSRANMGPIISPDKELYSIKAILPVNNKIYHTLENPIICDYQDQITLSSTTQNELVVDGIEYGLVDGVNLVISKSNQSLKIINSHLSEYYQVIKDLII